MNEMTTKANVRLEQDPRGSRLPKVVLAAVAAAVACAASACTQYANIESPGAPPPDVEAKMVLRDERYRQTFDDMAALERSLEKFFESAEWSARLALYEIDEDDESVIGDLQVRLPAAHASVLALLSNPALNANGRFACTASAVSGSIGDVERNMAQIKDAPADTWDWIVDPEILEDMRRLHRETQALRADMASVAAPEAAPPAAR
jgi:hypothetical protein